MWGFLKALHAKASEDDLFFMAGAITFNVLVAVVPLTLLVVGLAGFLLAARVPDPASHLVAAVARGLPEVEGGRALLVQGEAVVRQILEERGGLSLVGFLGFLWISTRLVATLRTVVRRIFGFRKARPFLRGKLFDALTVLVGGGLFLANLGITFLVEVLQRKGAGFLGWNADDLSFFQNLAAKAVALFSIWALFLLLYRYLPPRRVPWRTALLAASVAAVAFEGLKIAFAWMVTSIVDYRSTYGPLAAAAVLFFWIYYSAVVFILAGEVAQVRAALAGPGVSPVIRGCSPGPAGWGEQGP